MGNFACNFADNHIILEWSFGKKAILPTVAFAMHEKAIFVVASILYEVGMEKQLIYQGVSRKIKFRV